VLVVIGYGNELRRDDGVGPRVARAVAEWGVPSVRALAVHQLTPELAELLAGADDALFVDAAAGGGRGGVRVRPLQPAPDGVTQGHAGTPGALLALADSLYGRHPWAWLVTIPAHDLGFGEELSPEADEGMQQALRHIRRWVGRGACRA
jgi:hydrogenase maturation protease